MYIAIFTQTLYTYGTFVHNHSFILNICIAPLQENYSEAYIYIYNSEQKLQLLKNGSQKADQKLSAFYILGCCLLAAEKNFRL